MTQTSASPDAKTCPKCARRFAEDALYCPGDGTPLVAARKAVDAQDPYLGSEISGHIEVRQLVGVGAMGRVYRAFQRGIDRDVAVKILHRELSSNPQLVSRFHREAKVASRLQHPHVVQVHLAGQLPDGALYMVMEYLDGLSLLSALTGNGGALPLTRALHVTLQMCAAVGEAHAQGVVHRDLKPENVMLVRRGEDPDFVKVLDFGIAKISSGEPAVATAAGLIFGTARYMSPEGAQGEQVGPAGDVYAIATMLYQMLAGRTPFEGDQAVALLVQQLHDAPPQLKSLPRAALVPEAIAAVVMASLAKRPGDRPADGRAFGRVLTDAARTAGVDLGAVLGPFGGPPIGSATTKWSPPADLQAQIAPRAAISGADVTIDDADGVLAPLSTPAVSPRPSSVSQGQFGPTLSTGAAPSHLHAMTPSSALPLVTTKAPGQPMETAMTPSAPGVVAPTMPPEAMVLTPGPLPPTMLEGIVTPGGSAVAEFMASRASASSPYAAPMRIASGTEPAAGPPSTVASGARPSQRPGHRGLGPALVFGCFLIGLLVAFGVAYKTGRLGVQPTPGLTVDEVVAHANEAMRRQHWDAPPGDNVRDVTNEGLARWPGDARVVDVRARAAKEPVTLALEQRAIRELREAVRFARLAAELNPTEPTGPRLLDMVQTEYDQSLRLPPLASGAPAPSGSLSLQQPSLPPLVPLHPQLRDPSGATAPPRGGAMRPQPSANAAASAPASSAAPSAAASARAAPPGTKWM